MCLAVPGKLISVKESADSINRLCSGIVDFQGTRINANLIFTPEAHVGDWVLVHAGFAIQKLNEADALETWKYLDAIDIEEDIPTVA